MLAAARRAKTEARRSLRAPIERVVVTATETERSLLALARADVLESGSIAELEVVVADPSATPEQQAGSDGGLRIEVTLAEPIEPAERAAQT